MNNFDDMQNAIIYSVDRLTEFYPLWAMKIEKTS